MTAASEPAGPAALPGGPSQARGPSQTREPSQTRGLSPPIGVLALQGGYAAHARALEEIGREAVEVRTGADLDRVSGLVLPGGESTTQLKLIARFDLRGALDRFVGSGRPVLATCAGLILAAREVRGPEQESLGWLGVAVERNAWGRQLDSFEDTATLTGPLDGASGDALPAMFIRAPRIVRVEAGTEVIAALRGEPILVRTGRVWGATFHPELTRDRRVHRAVFGHPTAERH